MVVHNVIKRMKTRIYAAWAFKGVQSKKACVKNNDDDGPPLTINPFDAELLWTSGHICIPTAQFLGKGVKIRIFCNVKFVWRRQQDLSLSENNSMGRSCALLIHNTKVILRSFQRQTGKNIENIQFQACQWCSHLLERTDGDTFLVGYHFNTHFKASAWASLAKILIHN